MTAILIMFFISLAGISVMIGRKLILLKRGQIESVEKIPFEIPNSEEVRHFAVKNTKRYGYLTLVLILRFSVQSSNLLKHKYEKIKIKIKNMTNKYFPQKEKEVSKFLKMVSDYKNKIAKIRDKIIEEEKN